MVALPTATPLTTPVLLTLAIAALLLLQVPPVVASDRVDVYPAQAVAAPVMAATTGSGLTVWFFVATAVPQLEVTV